MIGQTRSRTFVTLLAGAALLLSACTMLSPATPTPAPAAAAKPGGNGRFQGAGGGNSAGGGNGGSGGAGARAARGNGTAGQEDGQARASGQTRGDGQARGGGSQGQSDGQARQGGGPGQGQGQGSRPGPQATPDPNSPIVNGEVDIVDGRTVTVATNTGWRKVAVPDTATILTDGKGSTADLTPGALVAVTGKPDGTAVTIRMFPPGANPRVGQFPMNGAQAGNIMTNAKIVTFDGKTLSLDYDGQQTSVTVPPETDIVKQVGAQFADIAIGARVQASGTVSGDTLTAQTVTIFGGQRPGRGA